MSYWFLDGQAQLLPAELIFERSHLRLDDLLNSARFDPDCDPEGLLALAAAACQLKMEEQIYNKSYGKIAAGLFKGLHYLPFALHSLLLPKLLGTYEAELAPLLQYLLPQLDFFIDVGCAEGYYVAGMAFLRHQLRCIGVDIDPRAKLLLEQLVRSNALEDTVAFASTLRPALLNCAGRGLVLVDVDGAEHQILQELKAVLQEHESITSFDLLLETDRAADGLSNESALLLLLQDIGFQLETVIRQDPALRFSAAVAHFPFLAQAVCGWERDYPEQAWIHSTWSRGFNE